MGRLTEEEAPIDSIRRSLYKNGSAAEMNARANPSIWNNLKSVGWELATDTLADPSANTTDPDSVRQKIIDEEFKRRQRKDPNSVPGSAWIMLNEQGKLPGER